MYDGRRQTVAERAKAGCASIATREVATTIMTFGPVVAMLAGGSDNIDVGWLSFVAVSAMLGLFPDSVKMVGGPGGAVVTFLMLAAAASVVPTDPVSIVLTAVTVLTGSAMLLRPGPDIVYARPEIRQILIMAFFGACSVVILAMGMFIDDPLYEFSASIGAMFGVHGLAYVVLAYTIPTKIDNTAQASDVARTGRVNYVKYAHHAAFMPMVASLVSFPNIVIGYYSGVAILVTAMWNLLAVLVLATTLGPSPVKVLAHTLFLYARKLVSHGVLCLVLSIIGTLAARLVYGYNGTMVFGIKNDAVQGLVGTYEALVKAVMYLSNDSAARIALAPAAGFVSNLRARLYMVGQQYYPTFKSVAQEHTYQITSAGPFLSMAAAACLVSVPIAFVSSRVSMKWVAKSPQIWAALSLIFGLTLTVVTVVHTYACDAVLLIPGSYCIYTSTTDFTTLVLLLSAGTGLSLVRLLVDKAIECKSLRKVAVKKAKENKVLLVGYLALAILLISAVATSEVKVLRVNRTNMIQSGTGYSLAEIRPDTSMKGSVALAKAFSAPMTMVLAGVREIADAIPAIPSDQIVDPIQELLEGAVEKVVNEIRDVSPEVAAVIPNLSPGVLIDGFDTGLGELDIMADALYNRIAAIAGPAKAIALTAVVMTSLLLSITLDLQLSTSFAGLAMAVSQLAKSLVTTAIIQNSRLYSRMGWYIEVDLNYFWELYLGVVIVSAAISVMGMRPREGFTPAIHESSDSTFVFKVGLPRAKELIATDTQNALRTAGMWARLTGEGYMTFNDDVGAAEWDNPEPEDKLPDPGVYEKSLDMVTDDDMLLVACAGMHGALEWVSIMGPKTESELQMVQFQ